MRGLRRAALAVVGLGAFALLLGFAWMYFWPVRGVAFTQMVAYAPRVESTAPAQGCAPSLPVASIDEVRPGFPALRAAEGDPADGRYALHVARVFTCADGKAHLRYALDEVRTAAHVRRVFSHDEQMAMDLNLMYFGEGRQGIVGAAQEFFHKTPRELDQAQWALLCGLIQNPARTSPYAHPERALARRNQVLDAMRAAGNLSGRACARAKAEPLGVRGAAVPVVPVGPPSID